MLEDCVLVLGSGTSILNLTQTERELLNTIKVKIGINKYAAFYELSAIIPTHIYFVDDYDSSSIRMLNYIFKLFRKNKIKKRTFIISENYKGFIYNNYFMFIFSKQFNYLKLNIILLFVKLARHSIKRFSINYFNNFNFFLNKKIKVNPIDRYNLLPNQSKIQYIKIQDSISKGNKWAESISEPLYHFKGSFSTVLNYISILYPNKTILLAGVDFNSSDYFFEKELDELNFETKDWTYEIRKTHNKHFSIIETHGIKIDDELPFMLHKLVKSNNEIYSLNESSYLVKNNYVEYISLKNLIYKNG